MSKYFNGLTTVNIELTNRCNKSCWMCGRRKVEKYYPELALKSGDMDFELVKKIAEQLPEGIVVQFHNNGEPLLYPRFGEAVSFFGKQIRCTDTNGKLIVKKSDEIIGNLDTLTISVFENDDECDEQYELLGQFLELKRERKPNVVIRCLGNVDVDRYKKFNCITAKRIFHSAMGSFNYHKETTVPEIGICLDLLNHMAIRRDGKVSLCVRFDPKDLGVIGDSNVSKLSDIWNSAKRKKWLCHHIEGHRAAVPICQTCEYWGVPKG